MKVLRTTIITEYALFLVALLLFVPGCLRAEKDNNVLQSINGQPLDSSSEQPENKLDLAMGSPFTLSYLIEYKQFNLDRTFLIIGARAENDKTKEGTAVSGRKRTDQDWLLQEGSKAMWVTGISGPSHHQKVILRGRLEEKGDSLLLQGYQQMQIGPDHEKGVALLQGEYVFYDLPGSKSNTCPVELSGDSVEIVYYDPFESVILRAVKPGVARLKIYTLWWRDVESKFLAEYEIAVK
jgi:hypothetical protein